MAVFQFRAFDHAGTVSAGEVDATDLDTARDTLWSRGLTPFEVKETGSLKQGLFPRQIWTRSPITLRELAAFTREFATLKEAEIPIDDTLRILSEQTGHRGMQAAAKALLVDILDGATLSRSLSKHSDVFPREYVNMIEAGELGGALSRVLRELASLLERRVEIQTKLRSALIYPVILIILAVASVGIVVSVLVPNVAPIFTDSGLPMPAGLSVIISIQSNWPLLALALALLLLAGMVTARVAARNGNIRLALHRCQLSLPLVGSLMIARDIARFCRTLGTLITAGVPLLPALDSARRGIANAALSADFADLSEAVRSGASLNKALQSIAAVPQLTQRMISVGEESGKLAPMLLRTAQIFESQVQQTIDRAMGVLTPVLTMLIAGVVGAIILSVMTAILSINELTVR